MDFSSQALRRGEVVIWSGALEKQRHDAAVRPAPPITRPWAKDVAWEDLKNLLGVGRDGRGNPAVAQVVETELTIRFKNGSQIQLKGASEPDTLRGRNVKLVVLDEYANMDPELWPLVRSRKHDRQARSGNATRGIA